MATYAIGDIHGCHDQLQRLLDKIQFKPEQDTLWFTGDLINGGPKPAETLRFIKSLGSGAITVLGNHDLVLLGVATGKLNAPHDRSVGFEPVLAAPDREELLYWLQTRPLVHYDEKFNALLVHAGVLPQWDLATVQALAREVEQVLRSPDATNFYSQMYGDLPDTWSNNLTGEARIRFIINCCTRMRFCDTHGKLNLTAKGDLNSAPADYLPWFKVKDRKAAMVNIIFGHWAAILGETNVKHVHAIDTGCMWGHSLTALRLDDWQRFSVAANLI